MRRKVEQVKIIIDGEVEDVAVRNSGYLPMVYDRSREWYVAKDEEKAGLAARKYWEEMVHDDPEEFAALIGAERLIQWALGQGDNFGLSSLEDFLEAVEGVPEEEFASYGGNPLECSTDPEGMLENLVEAEWDGEQDKGLLEQAILDEFQETENELGFAPTVAYRHN